jgi:aminomethyltransferase
MFIPKLYNRLSPKMGQFGKYMLPLTFDKFKTRDVVTKTRKPGFASIFDVSHMGIFETVRQDLIEKHFLVNLKKYNNRSKLSAVLDNKGNIIDDVIIGDIDNNKYRLVVNANTKDYFRGIDDFREKHKIIIAVQGDYSQKLLENMFQIKLNDLYFMENRSIIKDKIELCRCGYTGEDGFELYLNKEEGEGIVNKLVDLSLESDNVLFGGLIERDLLRLESGLCLSGTEFGGDLNVGFKALNMDFMVDLKYRKQYNFQSEYTRVGFTDKKPIRKGPIKDIDGRDVGFITSSNKSFNLNKFIGMGYLKREFLNCKLNCKLKENMELVSLPFIEAKSYRKI